MSGVSAPDPEQQWDGKSVDSLLTRPANLVSQETADKFIRASLKTDKQKRKLRNDLFRWAIRTTGLVLVLNFVVIGLYLLSQWGRIEATVMVAWISGTVVEILGIVAIIARYLFEPERPSPSK